MTQALLLSGGMDSIALAWWKRPELAITIDYGQISAGGELKAARTVAKELGIHHEIVRVDCSSLGSGDMAGLPALGVAPIPEWWPYRNQLLVTLAGTKALSLGATRLILGCVSTDSQHQDGTAEFVAAMDYVMSLQEGGIGVEAPAIQMGAVELARTSKVPRDILAWAHSCHKGALACGECRGCNKHRMVTEELWGTGY